MIDIIKETVESAYLLGKELAKESTATPHYDTDFHTSCRRASHHTTIMECFRATRSKYDRFTGYHLIELWSAAFRMGVDEVQVKRRQVEPLPYKTHTYKPRSHRDINGPPSTVIDI